MYRQSQKLLNSNISSTCSHNMANFGPLRLRSLRHPRKCQRVSRVGFVTAATSLQPNFAQCLAVSWAGTQLYIFGGCCPLAEFCKVQHLLYVQVLRSLLFQRRTRTAYVYNGCLAWYQRSVNSTDPLKREVQSTGAKC